MDKYASPYYYHANLKSDGSGLEIVWLVVNFHIISCCWVKRYALCHPHQPRISILHSTKDENGRQSSFLDFVCGRICDGDDCIYVPSIIVVLVVMMMPGQVMNKILRIWIFPFLVQPYEMLLPSSTAFGEGVGYLICEIYWEKLLVRTLVGCWQCSKGNGLFPALLAGVGPSGDDVR